MCLYANLLLFHELRVWAIVDDILAENRRGERRINLLGVDILEFAVENEVIALRTDCNSHLLAEENEGKDIAEL